jgi:hypothetical protein
MHFFLYDHFKSVNEWRELRETISNSASDWLVGKKKKISYSKCFQKNVKKQLCCFYISEIYHVHLCFVESRE